MYRGEYNGKQYHPPDLDAVISRAFQENVVKMIITGGSLDESKEALDIARRHENLYCTVGVHPTRCNEFEVDGRDCATHLEELKALALRGKAEGKVVAIGECGLDYDRTQFCVAEVQQRYFEMQLSLAAATGLPLFLHNRASTADLAACLSAQATRGNPIVGVVHSFTGDADELRMLLAIDGVYIGVNGCSLKTEENLRVVGTIPLARLMLETDAPWCDIRRTHASDRHVKTRLEHRAEKDKKKWCEGSRVKGRNEPCTMRQVLEVVAALHGKDAAEVAQVVFENTCRVFFAAAQCSEVNRQQPKDC